jgi:hypothetical protein
MKIKLESGQVTVGKHHIREAFAKLKDGYYNLTIDEWKDSRSIQSNALYWKWLTIIGNDLGYHNDEIHHEFIRMFAPVYTIRGLDGKPRQIQLTTSKMNTKQMHEYMERINQWSAENNIVLPQPDDALIEALVEKFDAVEE